MISIRRAKTTLRSKLIVAYTLLFVLVLGGFCLFRYWEVRTEIAAQVEESLRQDVDNVVNLVTVGSDLSLRNYLRGNVDRNYALVEYYYRLYRAGSLSEEAAKSAAADLLAGQNLGESGYVYALSGNGLVAAHSHTFMIGRDLSSLPYVAEQISRKNGSMAFDWRDSMELRATPKVLYMRYFQPWDWIITGLAYRQEFFGLVGIEDFLPGINALRPVEGRAAVYVLDSLGRNLAAPKPVEGDGRVLDVAGREMVNTMLRERAGLIRQDSGDVISGTRRAFMLYYKYMPEHDWIVAAGGYEDQLFASLTKYGHRLILIMLGGSVLGFVLSWLLSSQIMGPLTRLKQQLHSAAKGNLNARVLPESNDELREMAEDFNALMLAMTEQVYALEKMVDSRTSDYQEQISRLQKEAAEYMTSEEVVSERLSAQSDLFNSIPNLICARNLEDRFTGCNEAYARIFLGLPQHVIVGRSVEDFPETFGPQLQAKLQEMDHQVSGSEVDYLTRNLAMKCSDGKARTFCCTTAAIRDAQGKVSGVVNVLTDISYLELQEEVIY